MDNKGQVTVFVIVALLIVSAVFVLILLNRNEVSLREQDFDNPQSYLSICINERAESIVEEMLSKGGVVSQRDTVLYNTKEVLYLCKNINNFEPCVNQYPLYVSNMEKEFEDEIRDDAEQCFSALKEELENRNYDIESSEKVDVEVSFKPEVIEISLINDMVLTKSGDSRKFSRFDSFVFTKIQSIAFVVNEIVSQEAKWCYFSNEGFMTLYPEYDIRVYMMEDTTKIYTVKNKKTNEALMFATRGCAIPTGWF